MTPASERRLDRATTAVLVVVLFLPMVLVALGRTGDPPPNATPVSRPPAVDVLTLEPDALEQGLAWLEQEDPLRTGAVALAARTDIAVWGISPDPQVRLGADGWLFLSEAADEPCLTPEQVADVTAELDEVVALVRATGRRVVVAVAPDRVALFPEHHGATDGACPVANAAALQDAIDGHTGLIDLWTAVRGADGPLESRYFRQDSHWNEQGSAVFVQEAVRSLDPMLLDLAERVLAEDDRLWDTDLSALVGLPATEPDPAVRWRLPGSRVSQAEPPVDLDAYELPFPPGSLTQAWTATADVPLVAGETWFLHDSFGIPTRAQLRPFLASSVSWRVNWEPEGLLLPRELARADTIVIEIAQRRIRTSLLPRSMSASLAAVLADDLLPEVTSGPDLSRVADFVQIPLDLDDGTRVVLRDVGGAGMAEARVRDGIATFATRRTAGGATVTADDGDVDPVGPWTYLSVP